MQGLQLTDGLVKLFARLIVLRREKLKTECSTMLREDVADVHGGLPETAFGHETKKSAKQPGRKLRCCVMIPDTHPVRQFAITPEGSSRKCVQLRHVIWNIRQY